MFFMGLGSFRSMSACTSQQPCLQASRHCKSCANMSAWRKGSKRAARGHLPLSSKACTTAMKPELKALQGCESNFRVAEASCARVSQMMLKQFRWGFGVVSSVIPAACMLQQPASSVQMTS